jgi:hypothetical protein
MSALRAKYGFPPFSVWDSTTQTTDGADDDLPELVDRADRETARYEQRDRCQTCVNKGLAGDPVPGREPGYWSFNRTTDGKLTAEDDEGATFELHNMGASRDEVIAAMRDEIGQRKAKLDQKLAAFEEEFSASFTDHALKALKDPEQSEVEKAIQLLLRLYAQLPAEEDVLMASVALAAAKAADLTDDAMYRARDALRLKSRKARAEDLKKGRRGWLWSRPAFKPSRRRDVHVAA